MTEENPSSLLNSGGGNPPKAEAGEAPPEDAGSSGGATESELLAGKYKSTEDLVEAYKSLEGKLGKKDEELREAIKEELVKEQFGSRPESPGDYQLPESLGIDPGQASGNEMLDWWSKTAFEKGMSQEEFERGIAQYRDAVVGQAPDLEAEAKKLGENAQARIEQASQFVFKHLPEDQISAIEPLFQSAEGIKAVEALMESVNGGNKMRGGSDTDSSTRLTEEQVREMMRDPKYTSPVHRDSDYVKRVDAAWKRLYPE